MRVRDLHKQLGVLPKPDDEGAPCPECGTHLVYRLSSDLLGKGVLEKTAAISEKFLRDTGLDKYIHAGFEVGLQRPDAVASFTKIATDKGFIAFKEGATKPTTGYH